MDDISTKIAELDRKIEAVYVSVEKTRKYFLATIIISVATVLLPLVALAFLIPKYLEMISSLTL